MLTKLREGWVNSVKISQTDTNISENQSELKSIITEVNIIALEGINRSEEAEE